MLKKISETLAEFVDQQIAWHSLYKCLEKQCYSIKNAKEQESQTKQKVTGYRPNTLFRKTQGGRNKLGRQKICSKASN